MVTVRRNYQKLYHKVSGQWWIKIALAAAVLSVGCGFGGIKYWISREGEDQIAKDAFEVYASTIFAAVFTNWGNVLLGPQMMANVFLTNYTITHETFARFARPPGFWAGAFNYMQAIQFIPYVLEADRQRFEDAAQCAIPGYYIRERLANGTYIPALPRPEHFPVYFNEPLKGNEGAMGLDNTATANRYAAYNMSRQTGSPSLSERILLVQVGKYGAFILVPIFVDTNSTQLWYPGCSSITDSFTLLVRNTTQNVFGFVNGVLVYENFFNSALKQLVLPDVDVFIFDTSATTPIASSFLGHVPGSFSSSNPSQYIFSNTTNNLTDIPPKMEATVMSDLTVADRKWTVVVGARKGYYSSHRTYAPLILLCISIFTSLVPVVAGIIHFSLMKGNSHENGMVTVQSASDVTSKDVELSSSQ